MELAAAVSAHPVPALAAGEVIGEVIERLGTHPDVAVVFVTAGHAGALEDVGGAIRALLAPSVLLGAASNAVIGGRTETGRRAGIALWAGRVGPAVPLLLDGPGPSPPARPGFEPAAAVVLGDRGGPPPAAWPGLLPGTGPVTVVGGATGVGGLLVQDRVVSGAAVGVMLGPAAGLRALRSEGARRFGPPMVVTRAERDVIYDLDGRPALEVLLAAVADRLPAPDVALVNSGLRLALPGAAGDGNAGGETATVAVRGADRSNGALGVGAEIAEGTAVVFAVRDPREAAAALGRALAAASAPAGALVFRSGQRPPSWFAPGPADAETVSDTLGGAPLAGCATEAEIAGPAAGSQSVAVALFDGDAPAPEGNGGPPDRG